MRFWILILSVVYCQEKIDSKQVFNSTIYMSTLAEKAMKSIRYYIEVSRNFTWSRDPPTQTNSHFSGYGEYGNLIDFAEIGRISR